MVQDLNSGLRASELQVQCSYPLGHAAFLTWVYGRKLTFLLHNVLLCILLFFLRSLGRVNHVLVFNFNGFEIGRCITASVKDVDQVLIRPSAPYQRNYSRTKHALKKVAESVTGEECIIPGERPVRCVNVQLHWFVYLRLSSHFLELLLLMEHTCQ